MEIINLVIIECGIVEKILSYTNVGDAEKNFIELIKAENSGFFLKITDEDISEALENGYYDNNGFYISIVWSVLDNE